MDSAINGMAILNAKGIFIYVNPAHARMTGNGVPEAMLGKAWREVANERDVTPVENEIRAALQQHSKWFGPLTMHHEDGTEVPTEMAITALPNGGTICVSRDITQRVSAQRARAEAEIRYRMLVEQVAAVSYIAELGFHGKWLFVNSGLSTPRFKAISM
jgi:PAS domain S-box-containing protein